MQLGPVRQALRRVDPATAAEVSTLYSSIGLAFLPSQVGAVLLGASVCWHWRWRPSASTG